MSVMRRQPNNFYMIDPLASHCQPTGNPLSTHWPRAVNPLVMRFAPAGNAQSTSWLLRCQPTGDALSASAWVRRRWALLALLGLLPWQGCAMAVPRATARASRLGPQHHLGPLVRNLMNEQQVVVRSSGRHWRPIPHSRRNWGMNAYPAINGVCDA